MERIKSNEAFINEMERNFFFLYAKAGHKK